MKILDNSTNYKNPNFQRVIIKPLAREMAKEYLTTKQISYIAHIAEKQKNNPIDIIVKNLHLFKIDLVVGRELGMPFSGHQCDLYKVFNQAARYADKMFEKEKKADEKMKTLDEICPF